MKSDVGSLVWQMPEVIMSLLSPNFLEYFCANDQLQQQAMDIPRYLILAKCGHQNNKKSSYQDRLILKEMIC